MIDAIKELEDRLLKDEYSNNRKLPKHLKPFNNPSISDVELRERYAQLSKEDKDLVVYYIAKHVSMKKCHRIFLKIETLDTNVNNNTTNKSFINEKMKKQIKLLSPSMRTCLPTDSVLLNLGIYLETTTLKFHVESMIDIFISMLLNSLIDLSQDYIIYALKGKNSDSKEKIISAIKTLSTIDDKDLKKQLNKLTPYTLTPKKLLLSYEKQVVKIIRSYTEIVEKIDIDASKAVATSYIMNTIPKQYPSKLISLSKDFGKHIKTIQ